jgi:hypothetical protein
MTVMSRSDDSRFPPTVPAGRTPEPSALPGLAPLVDPSSLPASAWMVRWGAASTQCGVYLKERAARLVAAGLGLGATVDALEPLLPASPLMPDAYLITYGADLHGTPRLIGDASVHRAVTLDRAEADKRAAMDRGIVTSLVLRGRQAYRICDTTPAPLGGR